MQRFCFTQAQLSKLLHHVIERHIDYRDQEGGAQRHEERAELLAVGEVMEALVETGELAIGGAVVKPACRMDELREALQTLLEASPTPATLWDLGSNHTLAARRFTQLAPLADQCDALVRARNQAQLLLRLIELQEASNAA